MTETNDSLMCYSKILLPTDGSKPAWEASRRAVYLAKQCGASLYVIYVVEGGKAFRTGIHYRNTVQEMFSEGNKAVNKVKKLADKAGVKCSTDVMEGDAVKIILNFAKENKCDLIVIGSVGIGAIEKVFIGSVTTKVVEGAHCSVHVVRPDKS
jgi:nucleotide-binding universal stress UspA family protein